MFSHPEMIIYEVRVKTFERWSKQIGPGKEVLALAGFFYTGLDDKVQCMACGVELQGWEATDEPWAEHGKWSPNGIYLNMTGTLVKRSDNAVETTR
jgi:hypothetical protein